MAQAPAPYDLPDFDFRFPDTLNWQDSHGVGQLGIDTAQWIYGWLGAYVLEFWQYVLPFFIALFLFWKILGYFLGPVEQLDPQAQEDEWIARHGVEARRRAFYRNYGS